MSLDNEDLLRQARLLQRKVDRLTGPTKAEALAALELRKVVHYPPEKGYRMAKTELQLLDELDEARIVLKTYRRLMCVGIFGEALSTLLVVVATRIRVLEEIIAVPIVVGMVVALIFMCWWFWWNNLKPADFGRAAIPSPAARLRAAERAYRNGMLEQS